MVPWVLWYRAFTCYFNQFETPFILLNYSGTIRSPDTCYQVCLTIVIISYVFDYRNIGMIWFHMFCFTLAILDWYGFSGFRCIQLSKYWNDRISDVLTLAILNDMVSDVFDYSNIGMIWFKICLISAIFERWGLRWLWLSKYWNDMVSDMLSYRNIGMLGFQMFFDYRNIGIIWFHMFLLSQYWNEVVSVVFNHRNMRVM